jgi:hypothetical protein
MKIKAEYKIQYAIRARPGYYKVNPDYSEYDIWAMVKLPNGSFRVLDPIEFKKGPAYVKDVKDVDKWIEENFEPFVKAYCEDAELRYNP